MREDAGLPQTRLERLYEKYSTSTSLQALVATAGGFLPPLEGAAKGLAVRIEQMKLARLERFFEELAAKHIELTAEVIESDDFLHRFVGAATAAVHTARMEKVRLFAVLLQGALDGRVSSADTFDEYLHLLDELSARELEGLALLAEYETKYRPTDEVGTVKPYWADFIEELGQRFKMPKAEVLPYLQRLERTGLYRRFDSLFDGNTEGLATLTPAFAGFRRAIEREDARSRWPF